MKRRTRSEMQKASGDNASMPKYTIGIVSQFLGMPPQMLRRFEEAGLLEPARQAGKNRLYSDQDVAILEEIAELSDQGVNAVGIRHIIQIRRHVLVLEREVREVRETLLRIQPEGSQEGIARQQLDEHSDEVK
jgi:DNA-binding transcriptional MerR regulator